MYFNSLCKATRLGIPRFLDSYQLRGKGLCSLGCELRKVARPQHHSLHILMTLNIEPCLEKVKGNMAWHFRNRKGPTARANNVAWLWYKSCSAERLPLLLTRLHIRFLLQRLPTNPTSVIVICPHRGSEQGYRNLGTSALQHCCSLPCTFDLRNRPMHDTRAASRARRYEHESPQSPS